MTWTNVPKPTGTAFTNVNAIGKEQYDQSSLTYDDASTFYDGINPNQWTNVSKPTGGGYGSNTWAQMTIAWMNALGDWTDSSWTKVAKPV